MIVILMGVSGSGKSTVGSALAQHLHWLFLDADDFHPPANVQRMRTGIPLTDADREPWLALLNEELRTLAAAQTSAILACSALRERYRQRLAAGLDAQSVLWVHLAASPDVIRARLQARQDHFMPAALLESQFATLEPPTDVMTIPADLPIEKIVRTIAARINHDTDS